MFSLDTAPSDFVDELRQISIASKSWSATDPWAAPEREGAGAAALCALAFAP